MRIVLTGATGFLGRHTLPVLQERYGDQVVGVSSRDYDLMTAEDVDCLLATERPEVVVHYAAYSGGIGANRAYPANFYFQNTILTALMFDACVRHGVNKIVFPMGGCSYPAAATSPIDENQLWNGYPQAESAGYSTAKMMGLVAARAYRAQHGLDAVVIIPGNMYGEFDNFHPLDSHVVPAMVRRYHEANLNGAAEIVMWGSGEPQRDFVYAGDVAKCIPYFVEEYHSSEPVNISSGTRTSIRELAETIARQVQYRGRIVWDQSKPDGQRVKIFDVSRLRELGLACDTALEDGLARTIGWFSKVYAERSDGLRL